MTVASAIPAATKSRAPPASPDLQPPAETGTVSLSADGAEADSDTPVSESGTRLSCPVAVSVTSSGIRLRARVGGSADVAEFEASAGCRIAGGVEVQNIAGKAVVYGSAVTGTDVVGIVYVIRPGKIHREIVAGQPDVGLARERSCTARPPCRRSRRPSRKRSRPR